MSSQTKSSKARHLNGPPTKETLNTSIEKKSRGNKTQLRSPFEGLLTQKIHVVVTNWRLLSVKNEAHVVKLVTWSDTGKKNKDVTLHRYYYDKKTNRCYCFDKTNNKYYLPFANAYANPNYTYTNKPFDLFSKIDDISV